jgi:protein involved in polysaccharide export with SLBB domain
MALNGSSARAVLRHGVITVTLALAALLSGCETGQHIEPVGARGPTPEEAPLSARFAPWQNYEPPYHIGEGDKLRLLFVRTPELNQEALVRPDGMITIPSAGEVEVAGMKPLDAAGLLEKKSERFLRDPRISLEVIDPVSAKIYIGGEVHDPGPYRILGPMDPIAALQLAGGALDTGKINEVILIRRGPDDRAMLRLLDVRGLLEGRAPGDVRIVPSDILYVPRTRVAEAGLWVDQFINKIVPFQRSFSYSKSADQNTSN